MPISKIRKKKGRGCADCHSHIYEVAYYMVYDSIWNLVSSENEKQRLCLTCLAKRLGRKLTRDDFTNAPCNLAIFDVLDSVKIAD